MCISVGIRPWVTLYPFDQVVDVNGMVYSDRLILLWESGVWVDGVNHAVLPACVSDPPIKIVETMDQVSYLADNT